MLLFEFFRNYVEKRISVHLNKGRHVTGTLLGFDQFMNIVLGEAEEEVSPTENKNIGQVAIRGNSIIQFELVGLKG